MNQAVEDAIWRKRRREQTVSTEFTALFADLSEEAEKRGWAMFKETKTDDQPDSYLVKLVDVRGAAFKFPYEEIVKG